MNYAIGALNPFSYRLFNVLLHSATALLIFILTKRIFFYSGTENIFSLSAALIFALHPFQTEVVTYISNRSDGLAAFFYLLAIFFFVKAFEKNRLFYLCSYFSFFLALFSKEIAATLPALIFLYDYFFLSNSDFKKIINRWRPHLFYWVILLLTILFRHYYFGKIGFMGGGIEKSWSAYSYFLTQTVVVINYLKLFLLPQGQCIDHFILPIKNLLDLKVIYSLFFYLFLGTAALTIFKKNKIFLFSLLWFVITLLPTSSFFPIYDAMVERRLYLPSWGLCLGLVSFLLHFRSRIEERNFQGRSQIFHFLAGMFRPKHISVECRLNLRAIFAGLLMLYIFVLSGLTWKRNQLYRYPLKIWEESVRLYPNNNRALNNLGMLYAENKEVEKAKLAFEMALQLNPNVSGVYYNLGKLLSEKNDLKAESFYLKAIELEPKNKEALKALAFFYFQNRFFSKAQIFYERALKIMPNSKTDYSLYNNLGILYGNLRKFEEAEKSFQQAIELEPLNSEAYLNLAYLYTQQKRFSQAISAYQTVLNLDPTAPVKDKLNILKAKLIKGK
ncbi:MAG: tetratricopeptide repeat protein [Elusimicrobia bacterium]|nr:tetratricopeptide repeat protein [Elusimicrobiota bacterium]